MTDDTPRLYALRGATTVERDTSDDIAERTAELLGVVLDGNDVAIDDIVSVILSATPDLRSDFPAVAARSIGLSHTPLLCCRRSPWRAPWNAACACCCTSICRPAPTCTTCTCTAPGSCGSTCRSRPCASFPPSPASSLTSPVCRSRPSCGATASARS